ncbi:MAG: hypothetical protein ISS66_09880 [Desulfobacteraceae bacterium]|nr:hypothetical protein [Desulfobacteraceae bacterium]
MGNAPRLNSPSEFNGVKIAEWGLLIDDWRLKKLNIDDCRSKADLSAGSMEDLSAGIMTEIPSSGKPEAGKI